MHIKYFRRIFNFSGTLKFGVINLIFLLKFFLSFDIVQILDFSSDKN